MTRWTALVPIKPAALRKTRLGAHLDQPRRTGLTEHMLQHVLAVLALAPAVDDVAILAEQAPAGWSGTWFRDRNRGLNIELAAVAAMLPHGLAILHADLPALATGDVEALLAAAADGVAIAPDRRRHGTNALAAAEASRLRPGFGDNSLARHLADMPDHRIVRRPGLEFDIDLPADLREAVAAGHLPGTHGLAQDDPWPE